MVTVLDAVKPPGPLAVTVTAALLSEMLPDGDELLAEGPDGPRTCELRMGFYRLAQDICGVRG